MNGRYLVWLIGAFFAVFFLWVFGPRIVVFLFDPGILVQKSTLGGLGVIGDSFGVINSLFTGLALAAIVVAIFIQAEQLKNQAEQLKNQEIEVQATLDHIEKEDGWNRVRSKMDVLPLLSNIALEQLRDILGEDIIEDEFYKSHAKVSKVQQIISNETSTVETKIKLAEADIEELKSKIKALEEWSLTATDEEKVERVTERLESQSLSPFGAKKNAEESLERSLKERVKMTTALQLITELETYQADLREAYQEARSR